MSEIKTIYDFGLSKEQIKKLRDYADEEYQRLQKKHVHWVVADANSQQHWINDFFQLGANPW